MSAKDYVGNPAVITYFNNYWVESEDESDVPLSDLNKDTLKQKKCTAREKPLILFVEDDLVIQEIYSKFLFRLNCECIVAANAKQALGHLQSVDLIFLDIGLPQVDGITLCRLIREQMQGVYVPIIALTGYGDFVKEECHAAGFDQVVAKPILLDDLYKLLVGWLPGYKTVLKKPERQQIV